MFQNGQGKPSAYVKYTAYKVLMSVNHYDNIITAGSQVFSSSGFKTFENETELEIFTDLHIL